VQTTDPLPPLKLVPPITAAAMADRSSPTPPLGSFAPRRAVWQSKARPASAPEVTKTSVLTCTVEISESCAATFCVFDTIRGILNSIYNQIVISRVCCFVRFCAFGQVLEKFIGKRTHHEGNMRLAESGSGSRGGSRFAAGQKASPSRPRCRNRRLFILVFC